MTEALIIYYCERCRTADTSSKPLKHCSRAMTQIGWLEQHVQDDG